LNEREKFIDMAESQLIRAVQNGNLTASIYVTKALGRQRGYNEYGRGEPSGPGGIPIEPPNITIHFVPASAVVSEIEKEGEIK
jgi:hypothetical protein